MKNEIYCLVYIGANILKLKMGNNIKAVDNAAIINNLEDAAIINNVPIEEMPDL